MRGLYSSVDNAAASCRRGNPLALQTGRCRAAAIWRDLTILTAARGKSPSSRMMRSALPQARHPRGFMRYLENRHDVGPECCRLVFVVAPSASSGGSQMLTLF